MVVFSPERNKPFKCKTILLFCPPDWELTEMGRRAAPVRRLVFAIRTGVSTFDWIFL